MWIRSGKWNRVWRPSSLPKPTSCTVQIAPRRKTHGIHCRLCYESKLTVGRTSGNYEVSPSSCWYHLTPPATPTHPFGGRLFGLQLPRTSTRRENHYLSLLSSDLIILHRELRCRCWYRGEIIRRSISARERYIFPRCNLIRPKSSGGVRALEALSDVRIFIFWSAYWMKRFEWNWKTLLECIKKIITVIFVWWGND